MPTTCYDMFAECVRAIRNGELIQAISPTDKEYHFQNWFQARLQAVGLPFDAPARNAFPDFRLVAVPEGYEIKGLATPGRTATYDSNSQLPAGQHNGRTIFYVFGRYPRDMAGAYPVIDLVICHGDFLNVDHEYMHENKSIKGFGSYGDIMIRDRKMYVVPTPFALTQGTTGVQTLILPADFLIDDRYEPVGQLERVEVGERLVGYHFDLQTNEIRADTLPNPERGRRHRFVAYRLRDQGGQPVEPA